MPHLERFGGISQELQPLPHSWMSTSPRQPLPTSFRSLEVCATPIASSPESELQRDTNSTVQYARSAGDTTTGVTKQNFSTGTLPFPSQGHSQISIDCSPGTESTIQSAFVAESSATCTNFEPSENVTSLPIRQLIFPKSLYSGQSLPHQEYTEKAAVQELLEVRFTPDSENLSHASSSDEKDFEEIVLSNFAIYIPPDIHHHKFELRGLQYLTLAGHRYFLFDGELTVAGQTRYVTRVPFQRCSIGNYGVENHEVGNNIWIQSDLNKRKNVYYKLASTPSSEYHRFHEDFLWLANLAKHVVDYCQLAESPVSIHNFQAEFALWLKSKHHEAAAFRSWYNAYGNHDFRPAIVRNIQFLYKEAVGVDWTLKQQHPLWNEVMELDHIATYPQLETQTIVTSFIYDCFKHLQFGSLLKTVEPQSNVEVRQTHLGEKLHLTGNKYVPSSQSIPIIDLVGSCATTSLDHNTSQNVKAIEIGDVIAVTKDAESIWKDEEGRWKTIDDCWYFLVHEIKQKRQDKKVYHGLWLYRPSDTACAKMKYPYLNELFLSDNCTCGQRGILEKEILDVVNVDWHGHPSVNKDSFFIRQTYLENERFVTLRNEHKICAHMRSLHDSAARVDSPKYTAGQTVLARPLSEQKPSHELEVYEVLRYEKPLDPGCRVVYLRRFQRRSDYDKNAAPNQLVYTEIVEKMAASRIHSLCHLRCFLESEPILAPYNRAGAGNMFYITTKRSFNRDGSVVLVPLDRHPQRMVQGFDPKSHLSKKLVGMDLYCGGGNFGRGLEEGGAVENLYAVDLEKAAIHTYYANLPRHTNTKLFLGSVDDLLKAAMEGNPSNDDRIPLPGDIDFISAGSPCQGFSLLNPNKNNDKSLKNQSLVASVAAYVDFYRPKYGILENVISMAQSGKGRDEDVLSQLICALVAMGYQTHLILLDAWSSGSPQSRSRLFVSFAAPGLEPLGHPELSHSHPPGTRTRGLGRLANGEAFGSRTHTPTPFKYISAKECFEDLPSIGDGATGHCTRYPDHVLEGFPTENIRRQIQTIPLFPRGSNFASTWKEGKGTMSQAERLFFPPEIGRKGKPSLRVSAASRAWERLNPDKLMATVTVTAQLASARGSPSIHWNENRCLTLLEYKRAQSFPDSDVLVGSGAQCMKIIGNSVARSVAVSLGVKLRDAWMKNGPKFVLDADVCANTAALAAMHSPIVREGSGIHTVSHEESDHDQSRPDHIKSHLSNDRHINNTTGNESVLSHSSLNPTEANCIPIKSTAYGNAEAAKASTKRKRRLDISIDRENFRTTIKNRFLQTSQANLVGTPQLSVDHYSSNECLNLATSQQGTTTSVATHSSSHTTDSDEQNFASAQESTRLADVHTAFNQSSLSKLSLGSQPSLSLDHIKRGSAFIATNDTNNEASEASLELTTVNKNQKQAEYCHSLTTSRVKHTPIINLVSSDKED